MPEGASENVRASHSDLRAFDIGQSLAGRAGRPPQARVMRRREPAVAELLTRTMKRFNSQPTAGPAASNRGVR